MLRRVELTNYRNLNTTVEIDPHSNLILAPNGSGKSNFLEAIYFATFGHWFRPLANFTEIIGPDNQFAKVKLEFEDQTLEAIVSFTNKLQRRFLLNGKQIPLSKLIGKFPIVLFAPHAVDLAIGDPATRRNDLDDFLSLLDSNYALNIDRYKKFLRNRNAVLKAIRERKSAPSEITFWTEELVKLADYVFQARYNLFREIEKYLTEAGEQLYRQEKSEFSITYTPNTDDNPETYLQTLRQKFEENYDKEVIVGQTLYGPHKDDYQLNLNGKNLRYLGSRGQQRIATFIWKLAQHHYLEIKTGLNAILLVDDLMSELDNDHRQRVGNILLKNTNYQFITTAAESSDVPKDLLESAKAILL